MTTVYAKECDNCHTTYPGDESLKAINTIEISDNTCFKCHNKDYPPVPIGYDTHLIHVGKFTINNDYLRKHPKMLESLNCNRCHIKIDDCNSCHTIGIPHIKSPLGNDCKACHKELDELFRHPIVNLEIHNVFNKSQDDDSACNMCHNPGNMKSLKLASGESIHIEEPHRLCYQCHSTFYKLWDEGLHYPSKNPPTDLVSLMNPSFIADWGESWRKENTCTNCHNPHNPIELYWIPAHINIPGEKVTASSNTMLIIAITVITIIAIIALVYAILRKKDIKINKSSIKKILSLDKINKLSIKKILSFGKISKLSIKKILSLDKINKLLTNKSTAYIITLLSIFMVLYVMFGSFMPITAVVSESMSPNIERGDVLLYEDISRIDKIWTYTSAEGRYKSFNDYGDVIMFRQYGKDDTMNVVHRAIRYVNKGDEMWPGGPNASHAGYVTKGDNKVTNKLYDQQTSISRLQPIKQEWIVGVARYKIPYIGYVRLILS